VEYVQNNKVGRVREGCLCLAVGIILSICSVESDAKTASSNLQIDATVPVNLQYRILHQVRLLNISKKDAERGYVNVENGTILRAETNSPSGYMIVIRSQLVNFFQSVTILIEGRQFVLSPGGTIEIPIPYESHHAEVERLSYRFQLATGATAGDYPWPLVISVTSSF
jgi:hypothetical protein